MNFSYTPVLAKVKEFKYDWEKPLVENTYNVAFSNTFADLEYFIQTMQDNHVRPEFEVYDAGMLSNIKYLREKGIIKGHLYFQFVLGVMGGMPATVDNLLFLYNTARNLFGNDFTWSCGARGVCRPHGETGRSARQNACHTGRSRADPCAVKDIPISFLQYFTHYFSNESILHFPPVLQDVFLSAPCQRRRIRYNGDNQHSADAAACRVRANVLSTTSNKPAHIPWRFKNGEKNIYQRRY